jgi:hypothetical protein
MATHIRLIPSQEWFERPDQLDRIKIWCLWMGCPYSFLTSWDQVVTTNWRGDWAGSGFAARRLFLSRADRYLAGAQQAFLRRRQAASLSKMCRMLTAARPAMLADCEVAEGKCSRSSG